MSTLEIDNLTAITTNTNVTIKGKGSGKVSLGDGNLLFPDSDGSSGQFIQTDASGVLSFATAGGAWTVISTVTADNVASLTITGISDTYNYYCIGFSDILMATDDRRILLRMGDSSGIDSGASDYSYTGAHIDVGGESFGAASEEGWGGIYWITCPSSSTTFPQIMGMYNGFNQSVANGQLGFTLGKRNTVIDIDRIQIFSGEGDIISGRITLWGIAHA